MATEDMITKTFPYFDKNPYSYTRVDYVIKVPRRRSSTCCTLVLSTLIVPISTRRFGKALFMFVCQTYRFHNAWKLMRLTWWILGVFVFQTPQSGPRVILVYIYIYIYICSLMAVLPKVGCSNLGYSFSYCYLLTIKSLAYFE